MTGREFPGAITTFTVQRKAVNVGTNNPSASLQQITTGLSINLQDLQGVVADNRGGLIFTGQYRGSTFLDAPIQIGDTLLDENEMNPDGTAVQYQVQGRTLGVLAMVLHLRRTLVT